MCRILLQLDTKIRLISTLFRTLAAQHSKYYRSAYTKKGHKRINTATLRVLRINDKMYIQLVKCQVYC